MGMSHGADAYCDIVAEALILCDVDDEQSVVELIERLGELVELLGVADEEGHPAVAALGAAHAVKAGEAALVEVESAFRALRAVVDGRVEGAAGRTGIVADGGAETVSAPSAPAATGGAMPLAGDAELLHDFAVRANEHLDDADARLLELEQEPGRRDAVDAVFRAFHTIKGMAGFLALDEISERCHDFENVLTPFREEGGIDAQTVDVLFAGVDEVRALVRVVLGLEAESPRHGEPVGGGSTEESAKHRVTTNGNGSAREGTVRVAEARLDVLLDTIGELVIAESMASAFVRQSADTAVVETQLERLDKITRELQHMATSLRMVPLKATFGRMARLVRDLSHKAGKPITFVTSGEDTELDKAVVDRIQDPLIHALRNAVDHGIESAGMRAAAGKPAEGRIELRAFHAGGSIHIEVSDDGGGIDHDAVLAKARAQGLVTADEQVEEERILDLLYAPGFSTAATVTDVSGRGVGMDVVRRTVEELRGRIDIRSHRGEGSTVSIRLPVTLAIIDGMVCRVGEERYTVPVLSIERSVRPAAEDLTAVIGKGLMLSTKEGFLPIVRLHELLGVAGAEHDPTNAVVIIVSEAGQRAGLLVCELLGQQQTVIKPLGDGIPDQPGIAGGAIMPDGRVGLILDAAGLIRLAHEREG